MKFGIVDYASKIPPIKYACKTCGATGCKLWREYQTFLNHQVLYCCDCAGKAQKRDISSISDDGKIYDRVIGIGCDQIGWLVPAVPTVEGDTFWGYTSVPQSGVEWWKRLPTRSK